MNRTVHHFIYRPFTYFFLTIGTSIQKKIFSLNNLGLNILLLHYGAVSIGLSLKSLNSLRLKRFETQKNFNDKLKLKLPDKLLQK